MAASIDLFGKRTVTFNISRRDEIAPPPSSEASASAGSENTESPSLRLEDLLTLDIVRQCQFYAQTDVQEEIDLKLSTYQSVQRQEGLDPSQIIKTYSYSRSGV